jgi:predicted permease
VQLDTGVLMVAAGLAILATILIALVPAFISTHLDVPSSLRVLGRAGTETKGARLAGRTFVVAEIALACTLLVPAVLMVRSFLNLTAIDKGLDTRGLSIASVDFDNVKVPDGNAQRPVMARASELIGDLPGVEQVAWSVGTPGWYGGQYSGWVSQPDTTPPVRVVAGGLAVGPDFFQIYGIRLLLGRTFEASDSTDRVVIDEEMASRLFPGASPVGRTVVHDRRRLEVIGVVSTVRRQLVERREVPALYGKFEPGSRYATFTLKCRSRCPSEGQVRQQLLSLQPALRVSSFRTLDDFFDQFVEEPRFATNATIIFAAIALVAAAGGMFSVLSYAVARRRREFGIRAAMGASRHTIGVLVLRDLLIVGSLGLGIGAFGAWFLAKTMASQQFGVTTADPMSWAGVIGVLALCALASAWLPVQQAMRADPALLLKEE